MANIDYMNFRIDGAEYVPIDALRPYEHNAKEHPEWQVDQIVESIKTFGMRRRIGVWENPETHELTVTTGHGRLLACQKLGFTEVPIERDSDLSDNDRRMWTHTDNQANANSGIDAEILGADLDEIGGDYDLEALGFQMEEDESPAEVVEDDFDEDSVPAEPKAKLGDIYQLGRHRLMCGDSTDAEAVQNLMGGVRADITFTSPPYNAGFGANITKDNGRSKYLNDDDNKTQSEYLDFLNGFTHNAVNESEFVFVNIQMLANNKYAFIEYLHDNKEIIADVIIWDKTRSQPQLAENVLNSEFEFVIVFSQKANRAIGTIPFHGTLKNIVHISNVTDNEYSKIHNATFPMEFVSHFVRNFANESVLDLFGGTGTTLIACEQLGRNCFMMELDPHYVDVIIARWENLTGEKAVLLNG